MNRETIKSLLTPKGSYTSQDLEHYTQLSADKISLALKTKDPAQYMSLFDLIEDKDTSVGSEIEKRISSVENKFFTHALDAKFNASIEEIIEASIYAKLYGVSIIELFVDEFGEFAFAHIPKEYYYFEDGNVLLQKDKTKFIPKEPNFFVLRAKPVLLKVLWLVYAKHFVLSHYLKFAEFLGVPPIIVNASSSDKDVIDGIANAVKQIKSGDFAVLGAEDIVKVLEGRGSQADFLEFVRYVDSEIAKVINGASLGSNISKSGSYAQSKIHEENRLEIVKSDVKFASKIANALFKKLDLDLELNIAIEKDIDLESRARTLQILKGLGYDMTPEQIAYEFDLPNPTKKIENEKTKALNLSLQNKTTQKLDKDIADTILEDESFNKELQNSEEEILKTIEKIANECSSYEELFEKLALNYKDMELNRLEEMMFKAINLNKLRGLIDG